MTASIPPPVQTLPSIGRLFVFAVLLPAFVAVTNQLLFELSPSYRGLRIWLYPWMVTSTAVLSWCTGRYLSPAWLRWVVFAWSIALVDILTIAACMGWRVEQHFGYALVSAQVGALVMWGLLANIGWQWRLPAVLGAAAAVMVFSGSFYSVNPLTRISRAARDWNVLMIASAVIVAILSLTLRMRGFVLRAGELSELRSHEPTGMGAHQFGLKHLLIWSAALVPILLLARGLDFVVFKRLGAPLLFSFVVFAIGIAAANLLTVWTVLGNGRLGLRLAAVLAVPWLLAIGMELFLEFVASSHRVLRISRNGELYYTWTRDWENSLICTIFDGRGTLVNWFWLSAALLAALLLFLRASGYRLTRSGD
jgi:hypothetical protein